MAALAVDDDGIDIDLFLLLLVGVAGDVHDQKLKRQRHLGGRQAKPLGLVHQSIICPICSRSSLSMVITALPGWRSAGCG